MPKKDVQRKREKRRLERVGRAKERRAADGRRDQRNAGLRRLDLAFSLSEAGDPDGALVEVEAGLRRVPNDIEGHRLHLQLLISLGATSERQLIPMRELYRLGIRHPGLIADLYVYELAIGDLEQASELDQLHRIRRRSRGDDKQRIARALAHRRRVEAFDGQQRQREALSRPTPERTTKTIEVTEALPKTANAAAAVEPPTAPTPAKNPGVEFEASIESADAIVSRVGSGPRDSITAMLRALEAHDLATKERFDDLLCVSQLTGVTHYWYQVETARRCLRTFRGRVMLCDEVGLGKTIEAAMVLKEYLLRGLVRRALILVPAALVAQWRGELAEKFAIVAGGTDDGEFAKDPDAYLDAHPIVVASLALARREGQRERFLARTFDLVAVDEAHRVKDHKTESYQLVDRLKSRFLLLLTATPVENDLMELYNLVTLLRPGQLKTRQAFRDEFLDRGDPTSPKNREKLRGLLREVMIRNTRALSDARLPPRVAVTTVVDPDPAEAALYAAVIALMATRRRGGAILLAEAGSSPAALAVTASRMAADDPQLSAIADAARAITCTRKDEHLFTLLAQAQGKTVVFTHFVHTLDHIADLLRDRGMEAAQFRAGMSGNEKNAAVSAFRDGVRVLLATDVGAEGLNLQHATNIVNYDLPWNPMRIEQRIGRLHRIGQTGEVRVWNLCTRGTAEDRLLDVLDRRLNLFEMVIGEMDMVLGYLTDDRDFETIVAEVYRDAGSEGEIAAGFERIAAALEAARGRYERVKKFDDALLGEDYEL